ncbi:MAG: phosphatase PAP2 family protein [Candidatus Kapabacteria bacterium]|nr:phosphatase PAP2 family protein [Candidatus Kapabacteria bacterium]
MKFLKTAYNRLSIVDFLNLVYLAIMLIILLIVSSKAKYFSLGLLIYATLIAFVLIMSAIREKKSFPYKNVFMFIYPVVYFFSIFQTLALSLTYFNSNRYDDVMTKIDYWLVGVNPTVWIEKFISPGITEIMYILYFFYFPMPFFIIIYLIRNNRLKEIEEAFLQFFICYYSAYLCYYFIPVEGPRYYLEGLQKVSLTGLWLSEPIRNFINAVETNKLDCFPSLHSAIVTVTMLITYRYHKKLFYYLLLPSAGIMISLIYCRYHYLIDAIVGFLWAIASFYLGSVMHKKLSHKFYYHFKEN